MIMFEFSHHSIYEQKRFESLFNEKIQNLIEDFIGTSGAHISLFDKLRPSNINQYAVVVN